MGKLTRRNVLTATTATALSTVAGCAALSDDEDDSGDDDSDDSETTEPEEPETTVEAATLLVEDLAADRIEAAHERFSAASQGEIALGELEQIWMGYTAVGGTFDEIVDTSETTEDVFDAVDVTMAFDRVEDESRILVDDDLELHGLLFNGEYERPSYVDTDAIDEQEVTLDGDGYSLPGAVTTPDGTDEVPGVVLVHGTGPTDMDVDSIGTRMFQDLAEGLATQGIATLRYDKRTYVEPQLPAEEQTLDVVTVDDALLATDKLRAVDSVDSDRIVVVGHSQGGLAAPQIADRDGDLAGVVSLAAPGRPFYDIVSDQLDHQATVGDYEWPVLTEQAQQYETQRDRVRDGEYDDDELLLDVPGALWRSIADYDPIERAREIDDPLIVLQGDRDYQVTVEDDFDVWQSELADRSATTFEEYDGLNHLFMPGEGPSVPYEYFVRNNVDERVIDDIADWIDGL